VLRERTAFGRTIAAIECGDAVTEGLHPNSIPMLLWDDKSTASLELLDRSHRKVASAERGLAARLQHMDEHWCAEQARSHGTAMEKLRRKRGLLSTGIATPYIPPGIDAVLKQATYGSKHAEPPATSAVDGGLTLDQRVVMRGQPGIRTLQIRGRTVLDQLCMAGEGGFVLYDFLSEIRKQARARLVYAVFGSVPRNAPHPEGRVGLHAQCSEDSPSETDPNAFSLSVSFTLNCRGRYFGRYVFERCTLSDMPHREDLTGFGERRWLCAKIGPGDRVRYSDYACPCQPTQRQ